MGSIPKFPKKISIPELATLLVPYKETSQGEATWKFAPPQKKTPPQSLSSPSVSSLPLMPALLTCESDNLLLDTVMIQKGADRPRNRLFCSAPASNIATQTSVVLKYLSFAFGKAQGD